MKETVYALENRTNSQSENYIDSIQAQSNKSTILVIEDSADEWFLLRWTLSKQFPSAETVWLSDAMQTLGYLERFAWSEQSLPTMILLDLYLPSAQAGFNLLQTIKSHHRLVNVPVVVISRSNRVEDITQAFGCFSNAFLVKPDEYLDWPDAFTLLNQYWPGSGTLV